MTPEEAKTLLAEAGLHERAWEDTTERSVMGARRRKEVIAKEGSPALGLGVIVPTDILVKMNNSLRNNAEGRTRTVQALYTKPD